ncbi:MAG: hypothetical protein Q8N08_05725 [Methanobacteriaceae archaeon]|nr:hypothetical protein [Methanobacteriaceae archaeon]
MKIKNIDKKLKIEIWEYGTDKVKISIKTKQLFLKVIDNYSWLEIKMTINKSLGSNNEWFIYISDPKDVERYLDNVHNILLRIGASIEDHR